MATSELSEVRKRGSQKPRIRPAGGAVFIVDGEYWNIGLNGVTFPIKDFKGLGYIQYLLQHPGDEFHCLDLLGSVNAGPSIAPAEVGPEDTLPIGLTIRRS